jgi:putative transposase
MIEQNQELFPVHTLCRVLEISRSAYYQYCAGRSPKPERTALARRVKEIFEAHRGRYGARRIQSQMRDEGYAIGRYRVGSLMRQQGLQVRKKRAYLPKTTQTDPGRKRSPNLLLEARNTPTAPGQVIVGDITYLPSRQEGWLYLATWIDLCSRRVVSWKVDKTMNEDLVREPLQHYISTHQMKEGLIVHSDGGAQYSAAKFRQLISRQQFRQSMTRKDNHYDNAMAESFFGRLKAELLCGDAFENLQDANLKLFDYIDAYYNTIRKHSALAYQSPMQFEQRYYHQTLKPNLNTVRFF